MRTIRLFSPMYALQTLMVCLLILCGPVQMQACYELDFDTELHGSDVLFRSRSESPGKVFYANVNSDDFQGTIEKWKKRWERDGRWRDRSRYAVCLALSGELDQALGHFLEIEAEYPEQYVTAINLATVYEQKKQYAKALKWMEKAIALNPDGHRGSEWIHLNIIRLELAGKLAKCSSKDLIGQDFGTDSIPHTDLASSELDSLQVQLFSVLDQREFWGGKKDPATARLAFDLGNLNFISSFPTASLEDYELAALRGLKDALLEIRQRTVVTANYTQPEPTYADDVVEEFIEKLADNNQEREREAAGERNQNRRVAIIVLVLLFLTIAVVVGVVMYNYYNRRTRPSPVKRDRFEDLFRNDD